MYRFFLHEKEFMLYLLHELGRNVNVGVNRVLAKVIKPGFNFVINDWYWSLLNNRILSIFFGFKVVYRRLECYE